MAVLAAVCCLAWTFLIRSDIRKAGDYLGTKTGETKALLNTKIEQAQQFATAVAMAAYDDPIKQKSMVARMSKIQACL